MKYCYKLFINYCGLGSILKNFREIVTILKYLFIEIIILNSYILF